jgi:hypothetical protein
MAEEPRIQKGIKVETEAYCFSSSSLNQRNTP